MAEVALKIAETAGIKLTTLIDEAAFYQSVTTIRLKNINGIPKGDTPEQILTILKRHCESGIRMNDQTRSDLIAKITRMIAMSEPILITFSFAIGFRILNPLKFRELINLPHLGWMHLFWFFSFINEKVRAVYAPGIKVVIFDESMLLGEELGIASRDSIAVCLTAARKLIAVMQAPIIIAPMPKEDFPIISFDNTQPTHVMLTDEQIYPYLCSLPQMQNHEIMDAQYVSRRERNYNRIRLMAKDLWSQAMKNALLATRYFTHRKQARLFAKWLGTENYLDATLTDKDDRLVFDVTATLINHGMPRVHRTKNECKLEIHPEYRMGTECQPVYLPPSEFGLDNAQPYVFYYLI